MTLTDDFPAKKESFFAKIKALSPFSVLVIFFLAVVFVLLSVPLLTERVSFFKRAQTGTTMVLPSLSGCSYIPSTLYGQPASEWAKYECVEGVMKLKKNTSLSAPALTSDGLQVENLQVPSVKMFTTSVQTGDATVSYPIEVPPAAGGFAPSVALSYSSGSVEDLKTGLELRNWGDPGFEISDGFKGEPTIQSSYAGTGWNVSGLSQITKNSAGKYYLTLSGKSYEIDCTNGCHTLPESYLKIERVADNDGHQDGDDSFWNVWSKDGVYYRFEKLGYFIKREHLTDSTFKNKREYNKWPIKYSTDTNGNQINYLYNIAFDDYWLNDLTKSPLPETKWVDGACGHGGDCADFDNPSANAINLPTCLNGDAEPPYSSDDNNPYYPRAIYPIRITYGKNAQNKIEFIYNSLRKDNTIRECKSTTYVNSVGNHKLDEIRVYLGSNKLRTYELVHSYSNGENDYPGKRLLLTAVKEKGSDDSYFPIFQTFQYNCAPNDSFDPSKISPNPCFTKNRDEFNQFAFLLRKASNGYGASTLYSYQENDVSANISDGKDIYGGSIKRNRVWEKRILSSFDSAKQTRVTYDYSRGDNCEGFAADSCAPKGGRFCPNAHAVMKNAFFSDFEFLGYHYVKETTYSIINGTEKQESSVFYKFNQGVEGTEFQQRDEGRLNECLNFFRADLTRGTIAKQISYDSTGSPASVSETTYTVVPATHFLFPSETKSCSGLKDTTDPNLHIAIYSSTSASDFDNYGNRIKSTSYRTPACSLVGSASDPYTLKIDDAIRSAAVSYRTVETAYKAPDLTKYIVGLPSISGVRQGTDGNYLKRTWMLYYSDTGKLRATREADMDKWYQQGKSGTVNIVQTAFLYDIYGNLNTKRTYEGYAAATPTDQDNDLMNFIAPNDSGKREATTTYDSSYSAFPDIVTNPANFRTKMTYDSFGRPVSVKDMENDLTSQTEYDAFGRIVKKVSPPDSLTSPTAKYQYTDQTAGTNIPAMTVKVEKKDVGRYLSAYTFYDDLGQTLQTQSQSANSGKVYTDRTEYDGLGRAFKSYANQEVVGSLGTYLSSLPNDFISRVDYDSQGRAFRNVNPDGTCALTEFNGRQTFSYDPMGNMSLSWIDELGRNKGTAIYSVNKTGAATASVGSGVKTVFNSALSGIFKSDSALGTPISSDLFKSNFCSSTPAVSFPRSSYAYSIYTSSDINYDNLDRPVSSAVHDGEVAGTIISQATTVYDGFGRVAQTADPDLGNSYVRSYNALGDSLATEDNNGVKRSAVYDVLGRITDTYEGETLKSHLVYDDAAYGKAKGKLVKEETPDVLSKEYFYQDIAGRPSRMVVKLSNRLGGLIEAEDFAYDEAGRVKTQQLRLRVPDHPGAEDGFSDSEKLTSNYDNIGRLTEIQTNYSAGDLPGQGKYVSNLVYNSFNLVASQTSGNGKVESYTYNEADKSLRLKSHSIPNLMSLSYGSYDNAGNILNLTQILGTATQNYNYVYDNFYRLTNVTSPYTASYTYDNLNRMLTKNEKENLTFTYSPFNADPNRRADYYPLNAPKKYNGTDLIYQKGNLTKLANGNLISYDADNRITGITLPLPSLAVQSSNRNSKTLSPPPSVPGGGAVTAVPTIRVLTPIPASTPAPALTCSGKYFGKAQCEAKPEVISLKKLHPAGSCQLNKSLGPIDLIKPSAAINYWKWSFCWSTVVSVKGVTASASKNLLLKSGWNMVSFSVGSVAPREFFNSIIAGSNALEQVYSFENDTNGWKSFSPGNPDYAQSITEIKGGAGYWVKVNKDINFIYSINSSGLNTVQLKKGWNLIGVPDNYSKSISEIISPYTSKIESIWYYTGLAAAGGWQMYNVGNPQFSDLTQLVGGRAYWINALSDTEFNFNGGSSTTAVSYTYDSKGQRVKQVENQGAAAKITYYLPSLEVTKDVSSTIVRKFYPNNIMRVIKYNSAGSVTENKLYYTYADQISSTKVIADNSGSKVAGSELDYYPYGSVKAGNPANLPTNHLYTGQINDLSTGLYYYNQRYYDPTLGIFTSADRAKGPNRYSYVNGNPIMRNDPSGNVAVQGDGGGGDPNEQYRTTQNQYQDPIPPIMEDVPGVPEPDYRTMFEALYPYIRNNPLISNQTDLYGNTLAVRIAGPNIDLRGAIKVADDYLFGGMYHKQFAATASLALHALAKDDLIMKNGVISKKTYYPRLNITKITAGDMDNQLNDLIGNMKASGINDPASEKAKEMFINSIYVKNTSTGKAGAGQSGAAITLVNCIDTGFLVQRYFALQGTKTEFGWSGTHLVNILPDNRIFELQEKYYDARTTDAFARSMGVPFLFTGLYLYNNR